MRNSYGRFVQKYLAIGLCFFLFCFSDCFSIVQKAYAETEEEPAKPKGLYAYASCLMDGKSGRILFEQHGDERLSMASTTKIMTLLVILEHSLPDEIVTVSGNAASQPDVQLNIRTGEEYRVGDLVYSLMLESHNDVAVALAEHVGGSVEGFSELMNAKAAMLGLRDTHFVTPNGLDAEEHYSTAIELAVITRAALENEEFRKIISTTNYQFQEQKTGRSFHVTNKNRFLYMMKGAIGVKTGFTGKAGYCFVGALKQGEHYLISVVLACGWPPHKEYKWSDTRKLMEYGLQNYQRSNLITEAQIWVNGQYRAEAGSRGALQLSEWIPDALPVIGGRKASVGVSVDGEKELLEFSALTGAWEKIRLEIFFSETVQSPCEQGEAVGSVSLWIGEELVFTTSIVTAERVEKQGFFSCLFQVFDRWLRL